MNRKNLKILLSGILFTVFAGNIIAMEKEAEDKVAMGKHKEAKQAQQMEAEDKVAMQKEADNTIASFRANPPHKETRAISSKMAPGYTYEYTLISPEYDESKKYCNLFNEADVNRMLPAMKKGPKFAAYEEKLRGMSPINAIAYIEDELKECCFSSKGRALQVQYYDYSENWDGTYWSPELREMKARHRLEIIETEALASLLKEKKER